MTTSRGRGRVDVTGRAVGCWVADLEAAAEEFEDEVADDCGEDCDGEVGEGEDVGEGNGEGFALACGAVEFAHEEVGVEEEDDECDLDGGAEQGGEGAGWFWLAGHGCMVQNLRWKRGCPAEVVAELEGVLYSYELGAMS
jgi:hypothetical protein